MTTPRAAKYVLLPLLLALGLSACTSPQQSGADEGGAVLPQTQSASDDTEQNNEEQNDGERDDESQSGDDGGSDDEDANDEGSDAEGSDTDN